MFQLISPDGKFYKLWRTLIAFIAFIWITLVLPPRIAFEDSKNIPIENVIFDITVDSFFLIDIVVTFFLPYKEQSGTL